ncbi:hypothetical protein Ocin01_12824 [Orchesella cincta]|uniref:Uncharacterized protein n=1 Tax=Orchesella cincta TaxID=48709 RepID=A0A1D2MLC2_ORCCI|nr:hypothetical protein Ocin01_12824 [Orchesella cincta]
MLYKTEGFWNRRRHLACPVLGSNMSSVSGGVNKVVSVPNKQVFIVNLVGILILFGCPVSSSAKEEAVGHGNFTQSPTNHEEVLVRNQDISESTSNSGDDFWVGTHQLEFKPHPLLMPSTQSPSASQIPIPIIELGTPPTTPGPSTEEVSDSGDENSESSTNGSNKRKSRDRRKKHRDQRRLAHRTLWTSGNSNSNSGSRGVVIKSLDQQLQLLQQPVILTGGSGGPTSYQPPPQQFIPQTPPPPAPSAGNNGPYLVYVPPGMHQNQIAQASGALPVKAMSMGNVGINEIPMDYGRGNPYQYSSSGSGGYGESHSHSQPHHHHHHQNGYHSHSPNNGPNPHYLRNNILRVFMDKLASVGKALPIPFVTKYSQPPAVFGGHGTQSHHSPQMNHIVHPPIMQPTTVYNRHYLSRRMR